MKHDLLTICDLSCDDIEAIFDRADFIKDKHTKKKVYHPLRGRTLGMLFKKSSTRTRISFEVGMFHLGGKALFLNSQDMQMDRGETVSDSAKIFSQYLDALLIRTFKHEEIEDIAMSASIPVINGLTEKYHPCQILSDIYTIKKIFNGLNNIKIAYIGDGNNIAHSWLIGASRVGINLSCASPEGYCPDKDIVNEAKRIADLSGSNIEILTDPSKAVKNADIIYTDVWASMGQEDEYKERLKIFKDYQVNSALVSQAKPATLVAHCLPAHRGEEITSDVIDSENSIVFEQAKNRLYVQNAILDILMSG